MPDRLTTGRPRRLHHIDGARQPLDLLLPTAAEAAAPEATMASKTRGGSLHRTCRRDAVAATNATSQDR